MNRKEFLRNIGLGATATLLPVSLFSSFETQYRIPDISEFIKGFEFQSNDPLVIYSMSTYDEGHLDCEIYRTSICAHSHEKYVYDTNNNIRFPLSYIEYGLKKGLIRVKI